MAKAGTFEEAQKVGSVCSDLGIASTQALAPESVLKLPSSPHYVGIVSRCPMGASPGRLPDPFIYRVISHG